MRRKWGKGDLGAQKTIKKHMKVLKQRCTQENSELSTSGGG